MSQPLLAPALRLLGMLILAVLALQGCIVVPREVRLGTDGAYLTATQSVGPLLLVQSVSIRNGGGAADRSLTRRTDCRVDAVQVRIRAQDERTISTQEAVALCAALARGLRDLLGQAKLSAAWRYTVDLVSGNDGFDRRSLALLPWIGRLRYTFRWQSDRPGRSQAEVVDSFVHEIFHVIAAAKHVGGSDAENEDLAYLAGACGQLAGIGYWQPETILKGGAASLAEATSPLSVSSASGLQAGAGLTRDFGNLPVSAEQADGQRMRKMCQEKIGGYLTRHNRDGG